MNEVQLLKETEKELKEKEKELNALVVLHEKHRVKFKGLLTDALVTYRHDLEGMKVICKFMNTLGYRLQKKIRDCDIILAKGDNESTRAEKDWCKDVLELIDRAVKECSPDYQ